jgi:hypothetical protein
VAEYKITKRYSRKVSRDFQSWEFSTELGKTVEVGSAQELQDENMKLFNQAKGLTDLDIDTCMSEIRPQSGE